MGCPLRPAFRTLKEVALEALIAVGIAIGAAVAFVIFAVFDGFGIDWRKLGQKGDPSAGIGDD
jgi:hypothetical protein